jgi:hypothetical protein
VSPEVLIDAEAVLEAIGEAASVTPLLPPAVAADVAMPGALAASARLMRAALVPRLQDECGLSRHGAEGAARRIVGRGVLELVDGVTDPERVAEVFGVSRATIDRDAAIVAGLEAP